MYKKLHLRLFFSAFLFLICCYSGFGQRSPGYILYSASGSTSTVLLDTTGKEYHTWTHATSVKTGYSNYLMPGGILWRTIANSGNTISGGGTTGRVQKVDKAGTVLWDFTYSSSTYCLHHDICPLPNGNVLLISYDVKTAAEVTAAGSNFSGQVWSEKVMEVKPTGTTTGEVVWEWKLWDHLVQNTSSTKANYQSSIVNHPELLNVNYSMKKDWLHMNGIDYNPVLDQIVLSSHNLNMWFIIDHSTTTAEAASHSGGNAGKGGDFLYRYGNPASYEAGGTAALNVTHDSHWIPEFFPNAGRLMGFNNRGVSSSKSSVDQIDVPLNGYNYDITSGAAYAPATYTARHACNGYSSNMGSGEQLPNGNVLVCVATSGLIYEATTSGTTLWSKTASGSVAQAHHYKDCFVNKTAPAIPTITKNNGILTSSAAASYQWYLNGKAISGATSASFTPTTNGVYLVRTTDDNACVYQYATGHKFSSSTGIDEVAENVLFEIFPNPTNGLVYIKDTQLSGKRFDVYVSDIVGRVVVQNKNLYQLDLSAFENGIYTVTLQFENAKTIQTKIVLTK